jgi:hypothetical protein
MHKNDIEFIGFTEEEIDEILNKPNIKPISMKETAYISGKITGEPNLNRYKFEHAEAKVIQMGYNPINPHKLDHSENVFQKWYMYMRVCLAVLPTCNLVVALDDYKHSRGAVIEIWSAEWMDIPVFDIKTMTPVKLSFWIKVKLLLNLI